MGSILNFYPTLVHISIPYKSNSINILINKNEYTRNLRYVKFRTYSCETIFYEGILNEDNIPRKREAKIRELIKINTSMVVTSNESNERKRLTTN